MSEVKSHVSKTQSRTISSYGFIGCGMDTVKVGRTELQLC
jgi:hypothetical protein